MLNGNCPTAEVDAVALLERTVTEGSNVEDVLKRLWPALEEYTRLVQKRSEISATGEVATVQIATGSLLRPGANDDRIILLKERLLGPGEHDARYDDQLKTAVTAFQRSSGLEPDGLIGANTIEALNETRVSWIDRLDANLERWRLGYRGRHPRRTCASISPHISCAVLKKARLPSP